MTPPPAATVTSPAPGSPIAAGPASLDAASVSARPQIRPDVLGQALARVMRPHRWSRVRLAVDAIVLGMAASAAVLAAPLPGSSAQLVIAILFPFLTLALMHARKSPDERLSGSMLDTATHVLGTVSLVGMLTIAVNSMLGGPHPVGLAIRLWLFAVVYLALARVVMLVVRRQAVRNERLASPTLIVGAGVVGERVVTRLLAEPTYGLRPVGFLDVNPLGTGDGEAYPSLPVLGASNDLLEAVKRTGARHVILAFSSEPDHVVVRQVRECQELGVDVSLVPRLYESINQRAALDHLGGLPVVSLRPTNPRGWQFAIKHLIDRSFAFVTLLALSPIMLALALAVRLSSPGPILFRQRRVGRDGRDFDLLKFRTMREPSDPGRFEPQPGFAPGGVEGEDRRTPVGHWLRATSLDELPQLLNVLRGEMSLVGPRPERPEFVERFAHEVDHYEDRHRVKSGITGWAQVHGLRGQTSIADRVEWDNYYIQNWSVRLDLRILLLTVAEILRFRG